MSSLQPSLPLSAHEPAAAVHPKSSHAARWMARFERASEWLNPILVKECRQALKSRQFVLTFSVLLVCGWLWSIAGIAIIGPSASHGMAGPDMFYGYFLVLAFPLIVIVPFSAFRSLAAECEDRTFELVSITTLHPRQIVAGKLGSGIMQMVVYFSALAPCLAFTYLLRGIDILQITFILVYLFLASLALSMVALLASTVTRERHWQIVLSILLILGLLQSFAGSCAVAHVLLDGNLVSFQDPWFWIAHAAGLTGYVAYFVLFFLAAAAQLTFTSDNRSTKLRVTLLVQYLLFTGWMAGIGAHLVKTSSFQDLVDSMLAFVLISGLHWYGTGICLVVEQPSLSLRVKRSLPQSFLGRVFLTWFNPGPGTGYMFAVSNLLAGSVFVLAVFYDLRDTGYLNFRNNAFRSPFFYDRVVMTTVLINGYVVLYLGLGKLLVSLLRRWIVVSFGLGVALQVLLLLLGSGVPLVLDGLISGGRGEYYLLQFTNPFLTLSETLDARGVLNAFTTSGRLALAFALIVFALNLPGVVREVRHVRISAPRRVVEDEASGPA